MSIEASGRARFGDLCQTDVALGPRTTLKVGGRCPLYFEPRDDDQLVEVVSWLHARGVPLFVLGGGSNLLIDDDGIDGAVIGMRGLRGLELDPTGLSARVEAGFPLARLVSLCVPRGMAGAEGLCGIPGTVGGATFMNAGGHQRELGDLVAAVELVDERGRRHLRRAPELRFGYRRSHLPGLVVATWLRFEPGDPATIRRQAEALLERKRATQPLKERSSGCVFKNPPNQSAGRLIEATGLKGLRLGAAQVSTRHANFIVNLGNASGADVLGLIDMVQAMVKRRFGGQLQLEVARPGSQMMLSRAG